MNQPGISIRVLLFAQLAEQAGEKELTLSLPSNSTVTDALATVSEKYPVITPLMQNAAIAVNEAYADAGVQLNDQDTIALIPPVSGG